MKLKQLGIVCVMLSLAGCFQQASDSFESINSDAGVQNVGTTPTVQIINPNAEASPVVIVPNNGDATPTTDSVTVLQPMDNTPVTSDTTPTVVVIMPSVPTNTPLAIQPSQLLPTSTPPTLITPQSPSQLVVPTATNTTTGSVTTSTNGIITPTALALPTNSACVYVIQAGDNLFRIAVNNNATLAELLALNGLSENAIIQPGQEIQIPNCDDTADTTSPVTGATQSVTTGNSAPATLESGNTTGTGSTTTHTVQAGQTLSTIAQQYGVTINAIVQANNLQNPDRLDIGQQLVIPNP